MIAVYLAAVIVAAWIAWWMTLAWLDAGEAEEWEGRE